MADVVGFVPDEEAEAIGDGEVVIGVIDGVDLVEGELAEGVG